MKKVSLDGTWQFRRVGDPQWQEGRVPGTVYTDLLRCGAMPDPFWADNESRALGLMEYDYEYRRTFSLTEQDLAVSHILLQCEGLDTLADVFLNGIQVGSADNMHRTWEWAVAHCLHPGENEIQVRFHSPLKAIRERYALRPADGSEETLVGFPTLRKAHCMFGWDWGPRLPDAGIWRPIRLMLVDGGRIRSVRVEQQHQAGAVTVYIRPEKETFGQAGTCRAELVTPDGERLPADETGRVEVPAPRLWWPRGYGAQPLYTVKVTLTGADGTVQDTWSRRIGLRTMEVHREKDTWGECFAHRVNGVDIFAMGADYIPEDSLTGRRSAARTRRLLEDCAAAHFNTIRVWGGGFYPDDWFYDICDELGLLVWQDLMFACAVYNLTDDFERSIRAEVRDNLLRIRHHACLALICGNNEMELFLGEGKWVSAPSQKADYTVMYEYIFPRMMQELAPDLFYWPASPSSGGHFDDPNDETRGDTHFWEVWHGGKPFAEYEKHYFRYLSEFGFESFPCRATIETFAPEGQRNIFSRIMELHQKKPHANGKILQYLSQTYLYPTSGEKLIQASQLLQAEAVASCVQHLRRHRGRCMGAIYWQINDCWPVASWSSIDYFGRWKALHYFARRFFAPVLLSAQVESALTRDPDINQQGLDHRKSFRLALCNETRETVRRRVCWSLRQADGTIVRQGTQEVQVPALSTLWLDPCQDDTLDIFHHYLSYHLEGETDAPETTVCTLFCQPKYFAFADPQLTVSLGEDGCLLVRARAMAKAVCLTADDPDLVLEDNYFDMDPGERKVRVLRGDPAGIRASSVYDIGMTQGGTL